MPFLKHVTTRAARIGRSFSATVFGLSARISSSLILIAAVSAFGGAQAVTKTLPLGGSSTILSTQTQIGPTMPNSPLKEVKFVETKELFRFDSEPLNLANHYTNIRFAYTVTEPSQIESYGIVQFIRGCMFRSQLMPGGKVKKDLTIYRDEFGVNVPFVHKTWEIDNDSDDPLFSSSPKQGRFAYLRWNQNPASLDTTHAQYYGKTKPPHGTVFISDLPSSGVLNPNQTEADNTSLEFRTCIFNISDLPAHTNPRATNFDPGKALWCASWEHKNVWNFGTAQMDSPAVIDPICGVEATK